MSWDETVLVGFEVPPGLPVVTLLPQSAAQATTGQLVQGTSAVITFETVESAWVTGSYEIHLADDTSRTGSFEGHGCAGSPMCG